MLIHEVEKACREFQALFQQVLDNGKLTDGQGRLVDFRNALIIMTSKLGAVYLGDMGEGPVGSQTIARVMKEIRLHLAPEFINRIDEVVIFVSTHLFGGLRIAFWAGVLTFPPPSVSSRRGI